MTAVPAADLVHFYVILSKTFETGFSEYCELKDNNILHL